jgi:hypothetical protein
MEPQTRTNMPRNATFTATPARLRSVLLVLGTIPLLALLHCLPVHAQTSAPTTAAADSATVAAIRQTLEEYAVACVTGNEPAIRAHMDYHGPLETKFADAIVQFQMAQAHLRRAAATAFPGQDLTDLIWGTPEQARQQVKEVDISVHGNTAAVSLGKSQGPKLIQVNGQWKIAIMAPLKGESDAEIQRIYRETTHQADIYNNLADEVTVDKYHTPRQAVEILRQELLKLPSPPSTAPATRP